jgi:D-alanine-D-alanine ligase
LDTRTSLALLFGGRSPEHRISIRSARNILRAIDRERFSVVVIGLDPSGQFVHLPESALANAAGEQVDWSQGRALALVPGRPAAPLIYLDSNEAPPPVSVVFPITHGPYGEDGSLQGVLRHLGLPFVGPDVLGSAVCMDKDVAKRLLLQADLLTAAFRCFHHHEREAIDFFAVANQLGLPLFIKPANMGSSVGVAKAHDQPSFEAAIAEAFRYDSKVIVEAYIEGRELECAVMGNGILATTSVGEVGMSQGFYSYDAKYQSPDAAQVLIPAPDLDDQTLAKLVLVAKSAYQSLACEGMARVDMFLTQEGAVYVNEINTLPGFTDISMYPQLWDHAGTPYMALITALVELALERGVREGGLARSFED